MFDLAGQNQLLKDPGEVYIAKTIITSGWSILSFFIFFMVTLGVVAILLGMSGLDFITSLSASAAALANIGPGLGDQVGPSGNYSSLNDFAKWTLSAAMLIGRLELLAVYAILTRQFWRA